MTKRPPSCSPLVLIGGATDPGGAALDAFVTLANGRNGGRIVALTAASGNPVASARQWNRDFIVAGCHNVEIPIVATRAQAGADGLAQQLEAADGIFLGGGDQVRLVSLLGGTAAAAAIRDAHAHGVVIGGTSAGAAAMAMTTLAGNETDSRGQLIEQNIGPGLGLISYPAIIDTHFSQRRRLYRLFVALAEYPDLLGLGIDEDTAMVVRGEIADVTGSGGVTFVDGRDVSYSNAGSRRDGTPLTLSAVRVGIAGAGHSFDLANRKLIYPELGALRDAADQRTASVPWQRT